MPRIPEYALNRVEALHVLADGKLVVSMPHGVNPVRFTEDGFEQWMTGIGWVPMPPSFFNRFKTDYYLYVEPGTSSFDR